MCKALKNRFHTRNTPLFRRTNGTTINTNINKTKKHDKLHFGGRI